MSPSVRDVWFHQAAWSELKEIATAYSENSDHEPKQPREGIKYQFLRDWTVEEKQKFGVSINAPGKGQESQKAQASAAAIRDGASTGFDLSEYTERLKEKKAKRLTREEIQALIQDAGRELF